MIYIAHRGLWASVADHNSFAACERALQCGFGIEIDVRYHGDQLVLSHEAIVEAPFVTLNEILELYADLRSTLPIALNIKEDGLAKMIADCLEEARVENYFLFDMSIPELVSVRNCGLNFFTRKSDLELDTPCLEQSTGVWMDSFVQDWISEEDVVRLLDSGKNVCLVSPELHGNEHCAFWTKIKGWKRISERDGFFLCTDYPCKAKAWFDG